MTILINIIGFYYSCNNSKMLHWTSLSLKTITTRLAASKSMSPNPFNTNKSIPDGSNSGSMEKSPLDHTLHHASKPEKFSFMAATTKKKVFSMILSKHSSMTCLLCGDKSRSDRPNKRTRLRSEIIPSVHTHLIWSCSAARKTCYQTITPFTSSICAPTNGNPSKQSFRTTKNINYRLTRTVQIFGVTILLFVDNSMYIFGGYES